MKRIAKRTSTRRSLGTLSRLEICGRAHDVRCSGTVVAKIRGERFGEQGWSVQHRVDRMKVIKTADKQWGIRGFRVDSGSLLK